MFDGQQNSKIISILQLAEWAEGHRQRGHKIVHAHGCFDLLHAGHVRYLEQAKRYGDKLVVTVTADRFVNKGPGRPAFTHDLRCEMLAALSCVDAVAINDNDTGVPMIACIKPAFYVKGTEYENGDGDIKIEMQEVARHGGRTIFENAGHTVKINGKVASSSALINAHFGVGNRDYFSDLRRKGFDKTIPEILDAAMDLSVLFIGESIIDEYVYVSPLGKPPKEFVIACLKKETEIFSGGIAAAANHARTFFGNVQIISQRSVTKRRFVDRDYNRKIFEVYEMDDAPPSAESEDEMLRSVRALCPAFDVTVVIDFGHGMITPKIRNAIRAHSNFLAVNAQSNSANQGFNPITNYVADYICVDAPEARLALCDQHTNLETCARHLAKHAPKICITDGNRGSVAFADGRFISAPSFSTKVIDTMGAGDAFLAVTAPLAKLTNDIEMLAFLGNIAGAIKVGTVGHREAVDKKQVLRYAQTLLA